MEKTWETFWTTGKVTDYLAYCSVSTDRQEKEQTGQREQGTYGTAGGVDGYGFDSHAGGRL